MTPMTKALHEQTMLMPAATVAGGAGEEAGEVAGASAWAAMNVFATEGGPLAVVAVVVVRAVETAMVVGPVVETFAEAPAVSRPCR